MTTPTQPPSQWAMEAADEIECRTRCTQQLTPSSEIITHTFLGESGIAEIIDRHFQPLRDELERLRAEQIKLERVIVMLPEFDPNGAGDCADRLATAVFLLRLDRDTRTSQLQTAMRERDNFRTQLDMVCAAADKMEGALTYCQDIFEGRPEDRNIAVELAITEALAAYRAARKAREQSLTHESR